MVVTIKQSDFIDSIADSLQFISYYHPKDFIDAMAKAYEIEKSPAARDAIAQILLNSKMCAEGRRPICQDTGIVCAFIKVGMDVRFSDATMSIQDMVNLGVEKAYSDHDNTLRASIVRDPAFTRQNTKTNAPAVVHFDLVPGNTIEVEIAAKGGGSENKSKFVMLNPSDSIVDWVLKTVPTMGAGWCPPGMLGIGIGGTAEKAMLLAKQSLMTPIDMPELLARGPKNKIEELKVLQSLKPYTEESVLQNVICGQYKDGIIGNEKIKSYLDEDNIPVGSNTETYVALKAEIQNWRWAGVPFYLRTGKRLQKQIAEIVIQFKELPCQIFPFNANNFTNRLIIKLQPDETVQLYFLAKKPGDTNDLQPVYLDLDFNKTFKARRTEGYERLLLDVIRGKLTLFVRRDEQEAAWKWVEPILNTWNKLNYAPKLYTAGSWGPSAASALLARDGEFWHEELI